MELTNEDLIEVLENLRRIANALERLADSDAERVALLKEANEQQAESIATERAKVEAVGAIPSHFTLELAEQDRLALANLADAGAAGIEVPR